MGEVVGFARPHARIPSAGYKSGRNSYRETPDARSTCNTRNGGTSSHCETACAVTPIAFAKAACPPAPSIARSKGDLSSMGRHSSIALPPSQALLHCTRKALLYTVEMTLGNRIKAARERMVPEMTQGDLGAIFGVTDKAVSSWERGKTSPELKRIPALARALKVPTDWLLEGTGAPPALDGIVTEFEQLLPSERAVVRATMQAIRKERDSVA